MSEEITLSYSSMTLVSKCEQKYWHYKVNETPRDPDVEPSTEALDQGKALHDVMEHTNHEFPGAELLKKHVRKACSNYNCIEKSLMILAMCQKYYEVISKTRLKVVKCEFSLSTSTYIGFIDFIATTPEGYWWIGDLKTAKRFDEKKYTQLHRDPQLNLYASFAEKLAGVLELDPRKFQGCLYRVITKPDLKKGKNETPAAYLTRMMEKCEIIDILVPKESMSTGDQQELFEEYRQRCVELHSGRPPLKNYSNCFDFFRPCEWFSQCHGQNFSHKAPCTRVDSTYFLNLNGRKKAISKL